MEFVVTWTSGESTKQPCEEAYPARIVVQAPGHPDAEIGCWKVKFDTLADLWAFVERTDRIILTSGGYLEEGVNAGFHREPSLEIYDEYRE
jgi:hypothetical protein